MSTIQVKCYLFLNSNVSLSSKLQSEIRIFNLAYNSWNGIFGVLINRIRSAYESILSRGDEIKVYWQDDEDELVCFSSDDELRYAINVFKTLNQKVVIRKKPEPNHFLRIYIAKKQAKTDKLEVKSSRTSKTTTCTDCDGCMLRHSSIAKEKAPSTTNDKLKILNICPKKLSNALTTASQSVPIVKNDEQLKYAGEVLRKLFDPFDINIVCQGESVNKTLKPALKASPKEISHVNTDPEQLKKIAENIRNFLDTRGIETTTTIQNSICCNSCNEQINGVRYKCSMCIDYDLCEQCEKKGVHKEHPMIRVAKKYDQTNKDLELKNTKYCFSCNDPIIGSRYKCSSCINHEICETCEKKGVQKPHMFMKMPKCDNDQECKILRNKPKDALNTRHEESKATTPYNSKVDSRNSTTTPGVRFKFSSRLSYNFSENKESRAFSRSQSRLEMSSSVEEVKVNRINLNNKKFPLSEYYEKNFKTKSLFSSSGSNLSTGTLSPTQEDKSFSLIKSASSVNGKSKPKVVNQNIDLKLLKFNSSKYNNGSATIPSSRNMSAIDHKRHTIAKETENIYESDYENYSKKNDVLNVSSLSSEITSIHSSAFDSDIDIDKELKILDTVDRLRTMGYEGTWVKKLVSAKNGNINQVLDSIHQRPNNYWAHHDPKKTVFNTSHVPSKSFRL